MSETNEFYRSISLDEEIDSDDSTIDISFSSEEPYLRSFGWEVLSHDQNDVDLSFLGSGNAPFLSDHVNDDHHFQLGVVESARIEGGKGRACIRFSEDEKKQGVIHDIKELVRPNISVGYRITGKIKDGEKDGVEVYRCQWMPFEISSVAIPADTTIGVNRSADTINPQPEIQLMTNEMIEPVTAPVTQEPAVVLSAQPLEKRGADPVEVLTLCRKYGMGDKVEGFLRSKATLDQVKEAVFAEWEARNAETSGLGNGVIQPGKSAAVHTRKQEEFSLTKAFRAAATLDWRDAGLERETCQERAHNDINCRGWDKDTVIIDTRAALTPSTNVSAVGNGSQLVGTTYMPERLIDALWNKTWLSSVGTDNFMGMVGNASIPVITSNAVSTMVGEVADLPAPQALATGLKTLSPKEMVSKFAYSRQMLIQGLPNVEAKILEQLYASIGQKLDGLAWANSGVTLSTTGLLNEITQIVAMGTNGAAPTLKSFVDLRKALLAQKTLQGALAFVMSGALYETLGYTLKDSANTNSGYILPDGGNTLKSTPVVWSQNIPSNLTKGTGTNLSAAILGNWNDFIVAQWGTIAVEFDRISAADNSQIVIRSYSFWDMAIKRLESFAIVKDYIA